MVLFPLLALTLLGFQSEQPTATIKFDATRAVAGKPIKGTLTLTLPEGQHGYQNPPADEFENPITLRVSEKGFKLGKVKYPKGVELKMDGAEKPSLVYEGKVTIPFVLTTALKPKTPTKVNVQFFVDYQLCTMSSCYPPSKLSLKAPLTVSPAAKAKKS